MQFVAALLPVVIYIFVVYKIDNFSLISVRNLLLQVLYGMVTALVCFGLFQLTGEMLADEHSDYVNPVLEELVKGLPLLYLASRKKMKWALEPYCSEVWRWPLSTWDAVLSSLQDSCWQFVSLNVLVLD